jgi:maleate cis-trans isomerase
MVRAYFLEAGFEVVRLNGLKCATPRLIAQVPLADIRNALRELEGDDVEAMVTVGTALPAASVAAEAERWLASRCSRSTWCRSGTRCAVAASRTGSTATGGCWRSFSGGRV